MYLFQKRYLLFFPYLPLFNYLFSTHSSSPFSSGETLEGVQFTMIPLRSTSSCSVHVKMTSSLLRTLTRLGSYSRFHFAFKNIFISSTYYLVRISRKLHDFSTYIMSSDNMWTFCGTQTVSVRIMRSFSCNTSLLSELTISRKRKSFFLHWN